MTENPVTSANPVGEAVALLNGLTDNQLEEVGRALSNNMITRLNSKSLATKTGGLLRKAIVIGALLAFVSLLAFIWAYVNATKNIANGERKTNQADWGYAVDQYRFRNRMRLNLWSDSSLFSSSSNATLDLSNVSVNKITEERWLADSRAVYLNMLVTVDGKEQPAKVIYDFQRGEMHTSSPVDLWRVPNQPNQNVKLTDDEFQAVLNRYTEQAPVVAVPAPSISSAPSVTPGVSASAAASPLPSAVASPSPSASASPSPNKVDESSR